MISKDQITDWTENPVTLALKELCEVEFKKIQNAPLSEALIRGQPQITQENLVENALKEHEWGRFIDALEGDWTDLEIEDGSEPEDEE